MAAHQAPLSLGFSRQEHWSVLAISFSNAWKWKVKVKWLSRVQLLATPWTAAHQAPPSMGFSRQEDWSGVPLPSPLLYNIVVLFARHESPMSVHVSPILNPPPTSLPSHPSGLSQCTSFECPVSCIKLGLVIYFTYGNRHVSMQFSQIIPPSSSPTESKSLFFIFVSLLLSRI